MKKYYYHIQRILKNNQEWFKGDVHNITDKTLNNYHNKILSNLENEKPEHYYRKEGFRNYINNDLKNRLENNYNDNEINLKYKFLKNTFDDLENSLFQYLTWIREEIFENIRKAKFQHLPSRKNCIWVCTYEDLKHWWRTFKKEDDKFGVVRKKVLKLELDGHFHKADGCFLEADTYGISDYENMATKYWNGEIKSDTELEILFLGKLTVIEEYDGIDDIINNNN